MHFIPNTSLQYVSICLMHCNGESWDFLHVAFFLFFFFCYCASGIHNRQVIKLKECNFVDRSIHISNCCRRVYFSRLLIDSSRPCPKPCPTRITNSCSVYKWLNSETLFYIESTQLECLCRKSNRMKILVVNYWSTAEGRPTEQLKYYLIRKDII